MEWYDFVNIIGLILMITGFVFLLPIWKKIRKIKVGTRISKSVSKDGSAHIKVH
ncbi:hypothetical protein [Halalkalibacter hemicellulosilyticus]|uniref:hypothetical protein n=1 Tax=Halalkalibacter hemicellulosilyticus TaxID=127886 RepID=UPI0004ACD321|nr:hypothetical protein [Halalkalibacter hemicellulosilyticus]